MAEDTIKTSRKQLNIKSAASWSGIKKFLKKRFIIDRSKKLVYAIEKVTGRIISGKDSDEVLQAFGGTLD